MNADAKVVICDLDGTLFNIDHRLPFLVAKDWDAFFAQVVNDTPNQWCVDLLRGLTRLKYDIVFLTGRNVVAFNDTKAALRQIGLGEYRLFMRPKDCRDPDYIFKRQIYERFLKNEDIQFVLEDRDQVVKMWRNLGLTVLQCDEGEY